MIFDEKTLRRLARLTLAARKVRAGAAKGERRSVHRGSSIEFADYRAYTPGDDLRRLDWNAYARLERPYLKLFEEEEDLSVTVLLDASASMDWGDGEANKFQYSQKLAAALGVAALAGGDRLSVRTLAGQPSKLGPVFGPSRGQAHILALLQFLEGLAPAGQSELPRAMAAFGAQGARPGLTILISDLFSAGELRSGLAALQGRGHELVLIQPLAPDELDPPLVGDLRLVDVENGQTQEVTLDGPLLGQYRARLAAWQDEIRAECSRRGVAYLAVNTATPWETTVFTDLRRSGVLR